MQIEAKKDSDPPMNLETSEQLILLCFTIEHYLCDNLLFLLNQVVGKAGSAHFQEMYLKIPSVKYASF
jgi:hypothetical protein